MAEDKPFSISKWRVMDAWKFVRANRGAAGVDDVTIEEFERKHKNNLYKLWNRMSSGSYFPPPVRRVMIPKADGMERPLGIPTVADRVAQMVVKRYLEPKVEPLFHTDSYGYRPKKSALEAVGKCRERCWRYDWIVDLDIKEVRGWGIHRRSDLELADLARAHNAAIRGWINYYGRYYPSALRSVFYRLNRRLMRWAQRKYKRFRTHPRGAWNWLHGTARGSPDLFAHWRAGIVP